MPNLDDIMKDLFPRPPEPNGPTPLREPETIDWTPKYAKEFLQAYKVAFKAGKQSFQFKGNNVSMAFGRYMANYLAGPYGPYNPRVAPIPAQDKL